MLFFGNKNSVDHLFFRCYNSGIVNKTGFKLILADTLGRLTTMGPRDLARALDDSGYSMCSFKEARFLGMTNGGEFCYQVTYFDDAGTGEEEVGKVFVKYNTENQAITAEF